jgi:octaprenyl-diphosphate synthase
MAFQAVDDVLDLSGVEAETGKALFTDLREGKLTYPLLIALQREPTIRPLLEELVSVDHELQLPPESCAEVLALVQAADALEASREFARQRVDRAAHALEVLPKSEATAALAMVAHSIINRCH